MKITNYLKSLLDAQVSEGLINSSHYTYPSQFNMIAGRCKLPAGVMTLPDEWRLECNTVTARESGIFHIYFLKTQSQLDFDATQNEGYIDEMIDVAVDFVGRLKNNPVIEIMEIDIRMQSMYDVTNQNLTGVHLKLNLKEKQGRCIPTHGRC